MGDSQDVLRSDLKQIHVSVDKLATEIKQSEEAWRERSHSLADKINILALTQAVQAKQIEALEDSPHLAAIKEALVEGFKGVNGRLDRVNGRLDSHTGQIAEGRATAEAHGESIRILTERLLETGYEAKELTGRQKAAVASIGGVGIMAVLHAMFEMVKAIGPSLLGLFKH